MYGKKVKLRILFLVFIFLIVVLSTFLILKSLEENVVYFISPTDFKNEINVTYSGAIPNLFSEGKGVVAEGYLNDRSFFNAKKILAKHDENYMPPEVKEALEASK